MKTEMNLKINILLILLIFSLITNAQTSWEWISPKPSGFNPIDIHFFSDNNGLILNNYEIYKTNDGGYNWLKTNSFEFANDFDFIDSIGYVVGNHGLCRKTIDGGNTWSDINTGETARFKSVQLLSNDTIIITGYLFILKSYNGGNTWQKTTAYEFSHTVFINSRIGFGLLDNSGRAYKTIDGGVTWNLCSSEGYSSVQYDYIMAFNTNTIVIVNSSSDCLKSIDQGLTWTNYSGNSMLPTNHYLFNDSTCILTTDNGWVYKTTNSGETWTRIITTNSILNTVSFINDSIGYFIGDDNIIYKTSTMDYDFKIISPYKPNFIESPNFITYNDTTLFIYRNYELNGDTIHVNFQRGVSGVEMFEDSILYCFSDNEIFKSINYGNTWEKLDLNSSIESSSISNYNFADKNNCLITGRNGTAVTNNGGITWRSVFDYEVYGLKFINPNTAFFYRYEELYKSTDSGNTWEIIFDNGENITSFYFLDDNIGYVNGNYNYTYNNYIGHKTFDGGETWKLYGAHCPSNSTYFITENIAYQLCQGPGYTAEIYRSIDGATSWTQIDFPYINYFDAIPKGLHISSNLNKDSLFVSNNQNYFLVSKIDIDTISIYVYPEYFYDKQNQSIYVKIIATSPSSEIDNITFIYNNYSEGERQISAMPNSVSSQTTDTLIVRIQDFTLNSRYFCKLRYEYKGVVYNIDCEDLYTDTYLFNQTFLNEILKKESIKIYPTKTKDYIYISNITPESIIEIYNSNSLKIQEFKGLSTINLSLFPNGIYFIKVKNKNVNYTKSVIKK